MFLPYFWQSHLISVVPVRFQGFHCAPRAHPASIHCDPGHGYVLNFASTRNTVIYFCLSPASLQIQPFYHKLQSNRLPSILFLLLSCGGITYSSSKIIIDKDPWSILLLNGKDIIRRKLCKDNVSIWSFNLPLIYPTFIFSCLSVVACLPTVTKNKEKNHFCSL